MRPVSVNANPQKLGGRASDAKSDAAATAASPRKETARPLGHQPPLNVSSYQVRHMLNVMHTNSDCRYAPNSNKNVEKAIGYVPTLPSGFPDDQESPTEEIQNEPVFVEQALAICRRLRLHSAPAPSRPFLVSDTRTASFGSTSTEEEEEPLHPESSQLAATDAGGSGHRLDKGDDTVTPIFFTGPLSAALKLVERTSGCAVRVLWPAIILLLFNAPSPGNYEFFRNVLCKCKAPPTVEAPPDQTLTELTAGDASTLSDCESRRYTCLNEFILERGIKIIPWDCMLLRNKMTLAAAFRGTRLQQWLETLNERTEYPTLVAVGRKSNGTVLCSKLNGTKVDMRQTLHWLDVVTRAHFFDYVLPQPGKVKAKFMDASMSLHEASGRVICGAGEISASATDKTMGTSLSKSRRTLTVVVFEEYVKQERKPAKDRACLVQNSFAKISRQKTLFNEQERLQLQALRGQPVQKGLPVATCLAQGAIADATTLTIPEIQPSDWHGADQLTDFMARFMERFASGLPVTPVFLLARFSTAVNRCLNPITGEQLKPFLIYLHDDDGVGTPHFVANVLCSRRFNNRLYDANIAVWPLDLTGVMRPQRGSLVARSKPTPSRTAATTAPVPTTRRTTAGNKQQRPPPLPRSRNSPTPTPSAAAAAPRPGYRSLTACVSFRDRVSEQHSVPSPPSASVEANRPPRKPKPLRRYFWQPPLPSMAEHFLMMFAQHPAGATFNFLVAKKMLPTLLSLRLEKGKFSVDAVLYPNTTTKQGVTWLSRAIRRFQKGFLQPPSVNRAPIMEQTYA